MLKSLQFRHWAQPVTSRPWALITVIAEMLYRLSRGRVLGHTKHAAWQRATGARPRARLLPLLALAVLGLLLLPVSALAATTPQRTLALPTTQVWVLAVGALVPLVTYLLNHYGPQTTEPIKAFVLVVAAAIAGGVTQAINAGDVGFNDPTLQLVLTSIVAALTAHHYLWQPSGISAKLGGGSNAKKARR